MCVLFIVTINYFRSEDVQSFDNVRDLMKGVIETDVLEMQDAYLHFKATPNLRVIAIHDELKSFMKVTTNYIYAN